MFDFTEFSDILRDSPLEEVPVDIDTFISGEGYLNRPEIKLSDVQRECIEAMTQIYHIETLEEFMLPDAAERRFKQTMNEVILQLGKGSGKDFMSAVACCYIIYQLLCLKDPAAYYGKPSGDAIDILNIAQNAAQAHNVFFKNVSRLIKASTWFQDKYDAKPNGDPQKNAEFNFIKNVNLYSGHSERESWEGYNTFMVVLDEIAGFNLESTSGNPNAKTAESIYMMYRRSVSSRFSEYGKTVLLSFPRYKGDFIQQRYNEEVVDKDTMIKSHTFKIDPDLPDGIADNEFVIEWEHDYNLVYLTPKVYALRRATFEVNPTKNIEQYLRDFYTDKVDTLGAVCCMPPDAVDAFFPDKQRIEEAFCRRNGVDENGRFEDWFTPRDGKRYFVHVDLARKHDYCAVAMAHVETYRKTRIPGGTLSEDLPMVHVDMIRYWQPTKDQHVDFAEVREFILSLQRRGFNIKLTTFDQWESDDMRKYLESMGMRTDKLSVAKKHYTDMKGAIHDGRVLGPDEEILKKELLSLMLLPNDKVDHPRSGTKDLADATCGAIYNAIAHTPQDVNATVEIKTYETVRKEERNTLDQKGRNVIVAPKKAMPPEIEDFLRRMKAI